MASSEISSIKRLAQQLLRLDESGLPESCELLYKLNDIAEKASNEMVGTIRKFFCNELNDEEFTQGHVKDLIDAFPRALESSGEGKFSPISCAVSKFESISFVPLMAREGSIQDVGGLQSRGDYYQYNRNLLKSVIINGRKEKYGDTKAFRTLKDLNALGLLRKEDVTKYALLSCAVDNHAQKSFEFLVQLNPEALEESSFLSLGSTYRRGRGNRALAYRPRSRSFSSYSSGPFIQRVIEEQKLESFAMVLKTSVRYFPYKVGMLFEKSSVGKTSFDAASEKYGTEATMKVVHKCIPPSHRNYPILHRVIQHSPQHMNLFTTHYPEAAYLRDMDNRTLFLCTLVSGNKTFSEDPLFFLKASDDEVGEMDPVTELFPFALAASGNKSDLMAVYRLLRREPGLVFGKRPNQKERRKRSRST